MIGERSYWDPNINKLVNEEIRLFPLIDEIRLHHKANKVINALFRRKYEKDN